MRPRVYDVDDIDFDRYKAAGGTMSRAEFFSAELSSKFLTDSLSARLIDRLGARNQARTGGTLVERITRDLQG
jgi:hypothetical protein